MINNLADALVVIDEQAETIENLRGKIKELETEVEDLFTELEDQVEEGQF